MYSFKRILKYILRFSLVCCVISFIVMLFHLPSLYLGTVNDVLANSFSAIVLVLAIIANTFLLIHFDEL